ncbi:MAG TPA: M20/M25/M40 family metallo-hydrolase [Acidobacteriaceae bacterium]|nr:M20/M25/M40 family metallo-hydrolase [Acidobacteriaceae bacterium]
MLKPVVRLLLPTSLLVFAFALSPAATAQVNTQGQQLAHDVFKQLIETNTTDSGGGSTPAAKEMEQRFLDAGFPKQDLYLGGENAHNENLVIRIHGTGKKKPILFICHLDVVEAPRDEWHTDPFKFVKKDGFWYGRGTQDMKDNDAILVTTFLLLHKEHYKPDRDLILALTADEESGIANGVRWLVKNHPDLIQAGYVINPDGGGVDLVNGKAVDVAMDATEKLYGDFQLLTTNPGGHSSLPVPDNAIYHVADALGRLQRYQFPFELNNVTRAYFKRLSTLETGQTAADMKAIVQPNPDKAAIARLSRNKELNAMMRTTCVATRFNAGLANNALPQRAKAIVNCRILPGHTLRQIQQQLIGIFNDPKVKVSYVADSGQIFAVAPDRKQHPPAPLNPEVMHAMDTLAAKMWPGAPVIPTMAAGASDSVYTMAAGIPSLDLSGIALETNDDRAHARDERLPIKSFYRGLDFYYQFVRMLSGGA